MINVTDIKQYAYCPRIIYFTYCLPVEKKRSFKMELGNKVHEIVIELEKRRKLKRYGLSEGKRKYNLWLKSGDLGISGKLDMLICTPAEYFPVDFKNSSGNPGKNYLYQLGAYGLLVEENFLCKVKCGFIYLIPQKDCRIVEFDENFKLNVKQAIFEITELIRKETMPNPTKTRSKCYDCEYKNYCNDIW
jgi:CRISPR-associated exonuclease Cas4